KPLKAGPLRMVYESGTIRYVTQNGVELLRMVYAAVRDDIWNTVKPAISHEKVVDTGDSFLVDYKAAYRQGEINFICDFRIEGNKKGEISFSMVGKALSSFRKNRIGFCILHPVE